VHFLPATFQADEEKPKLNVTGYPFIKATMMHAMHDLNYSTNNQAQRLTRPTTSQIPLSNLMAG
jgi:hypothetical protein